MNVEFFYAGSKQVLFQSIDRKQYHGTILPASEVFQASSRTAIITVQEFKNQLVNVGHRLLEIFSKMRLSVVEPGGLRLEAILSGEMHIWVDGEKIRFRAGEYRLTDVPLFTAMFRRDTSCSLFISYYSYELLQQFGIKLLPSGPQRMPDKMANLIREMLHNPYSDIIRDFYYENCVRELLFCLLTRDIGNPPDSLSNKDVALIYKADALIASNLQTHLSIDSLARMLNTNSFKLKLGFNKVYGMGVFTRLVYLRMEYAKQLLETTRKPINQVASLAGYSSTAAFINAFRTRFGLTPRQWRIQEGESNDVQDKL